MEVNQVGTIQPAARVRRQLRSDAHMHGFPRVDGRRHRELLNALKEIQHSSGNQLFSGPAEGKSRLHWQN